MFVLVCKIIKTFFLGEIFFWVRRGWHFGKLMIRFSVNLENKFFIFFIYKNSLIGSIELFFDSPTHFFAQSTYFFFAKVKKFSREKNYDCLVRLSSFKFFFQKNNLKIIIF